MAPTEMHRLWSGQGCNLNSDVKTSKRLTGRFPATPGNVQTRCFQDEDSLKVLLNHPCNWSVLFLYFVFGYLAQKKKKSSFFIMKWSTQYRLLNSIPLQEPFPSASCGFDSLRPHRPSRMAWFTPVPMVSQALKLLGQVSSRQMSLGS